LIFIAYLRRNVVGCFDTKDETKHRKNVMEKTRTGTETVGGQVADRIRPRNCIKKNGDGDRTANMSCQE
jgi:hypothetical protein